MESKTYIIDDIEYTVCGSTLKQICLLYLKPPEILIIPDKINGVQIDKISSGVISFYNGTINQVIIPDSIKTIAPAAFHGRNIRKVKWPAGCSIIPSDCFSNTGIEEIEGISNVVCIEESAFEETKIKNFVWPEKCSLIPDGCFRDSYSLESIANIEKVYAIGQGAFENTSITEFSWPQNCSSISHNCFYNCKKLTAVNNIDHVEEVSFGAFRGCRKLKDLMFGENLKVLSAAAFSSNYIELSVDLQKTILSEETYDNLSKITRNSNYNGPVFSFPYFYNY